MSRWIELVTLGTGGAFPGERRFTSSHVLRDWFGNIILLDSGEGTQIRLSKASIPITRINAILITHGHGDHVNGLPGLLQSMYLNSRKIPLTIVAPKDVINFIENALILEGSNLGFEIRLFEIKGSGSMQLFNQRGDKLLLYWYETCHSRESYGFVLEWNLRPRINKAKMERLGIRSGPHIGKMLLNGNKEDLLVRLDPFRIAYTGDTRPCKKVVDGIKKSDILLHESTFSEENRKEAEEFCHSTGKGAAEEAISVGAKLLILTHVSSRYEGYEAYEIEREARKIFPRSVLAWDLARFRFTI